jgi:hypothetical protein
VIRWGQTINKREAEALCTLLSGPYQFPGRFAPSCLEEARRTRPAYPGPPAMVESGRHDQIDSARLAPNSPIDTLPHGIRPLVHAAWARDEGRQTLRRHCAIDIGTNRASELSELDSERKGSRRRASPSFPLSSPGPQPRHAEDCLIAGMRALESIPLWDDSYRSSAFS